MMWMKMNCPRIGVGHSFVPDETGGSVLDNIPSTILELAHTNQALSRQLLSIISSASTPRRQLQQQQPCLQLYSRSKKKITSVFSDGGSRTADIDQALITVLQNDIPTSILESYSGLSTEDTQLQGVVDAMATMGSVILVNNLPRTFVQLFDVYWPEGVALRPDEMAGALEAFLLWFEQDLSTLVEVPYFEYRLWLMNLVSMILKSRYGSGAALGEEGISSDSDGYSIIAFSFSFRISTQWFRIFFFYFSKFIAFIFFLLYLFKAENIIFLSSKS